MSISAVEVPDLASRWQALHGQAAKVAEIAGPDCRPLSNDDASLPDILSEARASHRALARQQIVAFNDMTDKGALRGGKIVRLRPDKENDE